jgi:hypothetical protein
VLTPNADYALFLCHDEWGEVYARSGETRSGLVDALRRMDVLVA